MHLNVVQVLSGPQFAVHFHRRDRISQAVCMDSQIPSGRAWVQFPDQSDLLTILGCHFELVMIVRMFVRVYVVKLVL